MIMTLEGSIHWLACAPRPDSSIAELLRMAWQFLSLSLFSLGGGNTLLAAYHHLSVEQFCWLTNNQFADIYALAEAAPGPSSMIAGLIGMSSALGEGLPWELLSAYTAETALLLPSTLVMIVACLGWNGFRIPLGEWPLSVGWARSPSEFCFPLASKSSTRPTTTWAVFWFP
jgi:chromate transporter